jgi:hypothetical protein
MTRLIGDRFACEERPHRQGGSAAVYKGVTVPDGRQVAVKVFTPARPMDQRLLREIFNRELEALHTVGKHPNVVEMIDWGLDDGEGNPYVVLEWVDRDLIDLLETTPSEGWDDFAGIAIGILKGIAALHALGRAHRDIKPENVLVDIAGTPKISDFGISKLRDRLSPGLTLSQFGTPPYMPPEEDDGSYTLSRDVFAYAVLLIRALSGRQLETHADVASRLRPGPDQIDVPTEVLELLLSATSSDPAARPASAEVALVRLERIQYAREVAWASALELHLAVANRAVEGICARLDVSSSEAVDFIFADAQEAPAFLRARDVLDNANDQDLFLLGAAFRYRLRPHNIQVGVLAVIGATKTPPSELEIQRARAWKGAVSLRRTAPLDPSRASRAIEQLQAAITEHEQARAELEAQDRERQLFRSWRAVLDAKRHIEEVRGVPLRYRSFHVDGQRIHFELTQPAGLESIGEPRLVRIGRGQAVAGEVEEASEERLTLFRERGDPGSLPRSGVLEYDSDAARFAIDRQRDALEAVRHDRAVRGDLAAKLLHPETARKPDPVSVGEFFDPNLDDVKKQAIRAALGTEDFLLVEGPPGTGKTTFIAELIAQFLRLNPGKRVLLSSQTHIALDNALERLRRLVPAAGLLRIGRSDRIAAEVEELRLDNQMAAWRDEVLRRGRKFMRQYAKDIGIAVPEADVVELTGELRRVRQTLYELRSSIQHRQAERREVASDLAKLADLANNVLDTASRIEDSLKASSLGALREAAQLYLDEGIKLAETLDAGGTLSSKLVDLEQSLSAWRDEVSALSTTEQDLRTRVAQLLGLSEGEVPATEELLELANRSASIRQHPQLESIQAIYAEWEQRFGRGSQFNGALLGRSSVVAATCVGLAGIRGALDVAFDLCILDEASKATATESLVPMSRGRRWIVVGDRQQLPPFQEDALRNPEIQAKFELSPQELEHTLFDYLSDTLPSECKHLLSEQYRMAPPIGRLISECFYDGALISHPRATSNTVSIVFGAPVVWLSTSRHPKRRELPVGTSFANPLEAQEIKAVLARLHFTLSHRPARGPELPVRIAVLTGYAAQRDHIRRALDSTLPEWIHMQVQVSSVDAFQGKEADIAIFSMTRSNARSDLGFLSMRRRINVALSRGRDALVIVGDADFCRSSSAAESPMREVLRHIEGDSECRTDEVTAP